MLRTLGQHFHQLTISVDTHVKSTKPKENGRETKLKSEFGEH